ncbi:MAG: ABC transporter ATP-binding protein [Desulfuromonadaceae bacterium]|nr:ABC transporter ATP-binding protein [Desulfuromonadaceae bacterium]
MSPLLRLEGVSRWFGSGRTEVRALTDITLDLALGEQVALIGPSGSGKTTLLNLLGALDRPTAGQITIGQQRLSAFSERQACEFRRRQVGFVFQDNALLPELTLQENVELPLVLAGMSRRERLKRVCEVIEQLGLVARYQAYPAELSGGEKQRASVARALIHRPSLVLADEPTANLDAQSAQAVLALLRGLAHQQQLTLLVATHDPRVYTSFEHHLHLDDGRLILSEPSGVPGLGRGLPHSVSG